MTKRTLDSAKLELAAALADGAEELLVLVDGSAEAHLLDEAALTELLGYDTLDLSAAGLKSLVHPEDWPQVVDRFRNLNKQQGNRRALRYRIRHNDGRYLPVVSSAVNRLGDGLLDALLIRTRRCPPEEAQPEHGLDQPGPVVLDQTAFVTALGESVQDKVDKIWSATRFAMPATKDRRYDYAVLRLQLDRFRMVLGAHGTKTAMRVLEKTTERMAACLGPQDLLAHLGGAEFAVLLRGNGDILHATRMADRIQDAVGEGIDIDGDPVSTAAIIGIATSDRRYQHADEVLRDAEAALNRARKQHRRRRRAAFDTDIRREDTEFIALLTQLHEAQKQGQFFLRYQPIVRLRTGLLSGFEALVRWLHPSRGTVPPAQFVPIAEQTGFIVELGQWVLREACQQMAHWQQAHPSSRALTMSVNISAEQLGEELLHTVEQVLTETDLEPAQLRLEITESAVMKNREVAAKGLAMLRLYGVRLSVDDFGTGYASFSHLHQLPYDTLKIDRAFVARLDLQDDDTSVDHGDIVGAMINLAHTLKLEVVGEGIETLEQAEILRHMGCDHGQGFYFAKPMDAELAGEMIATNPTW